MRFWRYVITLAWLLDGISVSGQTLVEEPVLEFEPPSSEAAARYDDGEVTFYRSPSSCCPTSRPTFGLFGEAEILFFHYNRADGNRSGNYSLIPVVDSDDVDFDAEASPRLTLGYRTASGLGFRARYFDYSANAPAVSEAVAASMSVETYTLDFELFDQFRFGRDWTFELSGGVRYNEFNETMVNELPFAPIRENIFRGFGGIIGGEAQRSVGSYGAFYVRGRGAILTGDKQVNNGVGGTPDEAVRLNESIFSVMELASGMQYTRGLFGNRVLMQLRGGYEWQLWNNYSSSFATITSVSNTPSILPSFGGPADVGLHGATLGMTWSF